jgi:predicted MPP superfamily phosphohydrolase
MTKSKPSFRFVQISDIHIGSPYSYHYQPSWVENFEQCLKQISELKPQPEFLILTGDMTRDGNTHLFELRYILEWMQKWPYKVYCIPGNHDVGGRPETQKESRLTQKSHEHFLKVFSKDNFDFIYNDIQFIGLDSFLFGSKIPAEEKQWEWMHFMTEKIIQEKRRSFWFMHTLPFWKAPFEALETVPKYDSSEGYRLTDHASQIKLMTLIKKCKADFVACGHTHVYLDRTVDGIRQISCPSTAFLADEASELGYMVYDIEGLTVNATMERLQKVSKTVGYGGGILNIALRDYSLAWEKNEETSKEINFIKSQI